MLRQRATSIRTQVLAIILLGAILPLTLVGFWLTGSNVRSGERLLSDQLDSSLTNIERLVARRWQFRGGELLWLADNANARDALAAGVVSGKDSQFFAQLGRAVSRDIPSFLYRDRHGRQLYAWTRPDSSSFSGAIPANGALRRAASAGGSTIAGRTPITVHVRQMVTHSRDTVGVMEAWVLLDALVPPDSEQHLVPGSALAVRHRTEGTVVKPLAQQERFPEAPDFTVAGKHWLVRRRTISEPPLELAMGAPVASYVEPFERAGAFGTVALIVVTVFAVVLSGFFTSRLAGSVGALVDAAGTVAAGDLTHNASPTGPREFRQLAVSFNAMTDSLRTMMQELAQRRALAAVGEFAAALSHEVRNALTSVQIDLERVDERTEDAKNQQLVSRSLAHVRRLDAAVTGSLRIARSGHVQPAEVQLDEVLTRAINGAQGNFAAAGAQLAPLVFAEPIAVLGDGEALQQLFLNLLLNAQQGLSSGGTATVQMTRVDRRVEIVITDTGKGMSAEQLDRAFEPFYSTRSTGTGLGLPIARQIAVAHGGDLSICSTPGVGTVVTVSLPTPPTDMPGAT